MIILKALMIFFVVFGGTYLGIYIAETTSVAWAIGMTTGAISMLLAKGI